MKWCEFISDLCPLIPRTFGCCCHFFLLFSDVGPRTTATALSLVWVVPVGPSARSKDLVVVFKGLCLEGEWRAFLLPSAESVTRDLTSKSKWPTRFSRIGHSPASARYGSRNHPCRYSLPLLVCPALHYFRQDLGKQQTRRQRVSLLYLKIHFLSILFPKPTKNLRPSAGSQLVKALFEVLF